MAEAEGPAPGRGTGAEAGFAQHAEQTEWRGHVVSVTRVQLSAPDGEPFDREVVRHPGAVAVVAVDDDGCVVLLRQYRAPFDEPILEVPAGTCDVDGEPPEETAVRELAEEAGVRAARLERLATVYNSPGFCDQKTVIFLATGLSSCPTDRAGVEEHWMSVERVPLGEVAGLVERGELHDSTTIVGTLLARDVLAARSRP